MAAIKITIPGSQEQDGETPIVILGPNGSGKTQLAQKISRANPVTAISAQRRTWVDDTLPVQEEQNLRSQVQSQQNNWATHSWQPTEEINFILSSLIQEHANVLSMANEQALESGAPQEPVRNTKLIQLQALWKTLFPKRKLEIGGYFPKVKRIDGPDEGPVYHLRQMSDGERTVLFMAGRVLTAPHPIILVDEPELHMHSRLSVRFWDEAEKLRPDCRFVYVTHDLNFALSRRRATVLVARSNDTTEAVLVDELPSSVAAEILGAATLPFYAKRIFLFEGEQGSGFASQFFAAWFDDPETFAIPSGGRDSVCAAVAGLRTVGVVAAEVIGLVDRDFYSEEALGATTKGVTVLPLHEMESVLCDRELVGALAHHLGKDPPDVWDNFIELVRNTYEGQTFSGVVARRVRSRVGDLLKGAFFNSQVVADVNQTGLNHAAALDALDLSTRTQSIFAEETARVTAALADGGTPMLAILPGKHLLDLLTRVMGLSNDAVNELVVASLNRRNLKSADPVFALGEKVEVALLKYLPKRRTEN